jgi:hypothetical protein
VQRDSDAPSMRIFRYSESASILGPHRSNSCCIAFGKAYLKQGVSRRAEPEFAVVLVRGVAHHLVDAGGVEVAEEPTDHVRMVRAGGPVGRTSGLPGAPRAYCETSPIDFRRAAGLEFLSVTALPPSRPSHLNPLFRINVRKHPARILIVRLNFPGLLSIRELRFGIDA